MKALQELIEHYFFRVQLTYAYTQLYSPEALRHGQTYEDGLICLIPTTTRDLEDKLQDAYKAIKNRCVDMNPSEKEKFRKLVQKEYDSFRSQIDIPRIEEFYQLLMSL